MRMRSTIQRRRFANKRMRQFLIALTLENQSQTLGKYTETIVIFTRKQFVLHVYVIKAHVSVVLSCRKHAKLSGRGVFSAVYACL
jgi:hypothetical protein